MLSFGVNLRLDGECATLGSAQSSFDVFLQKIELQLDCIELGVLFFIGQKEYSLHSLFRFCL